MKLTLATLLLVALGAGCVSVDPGSDAGFGDGGTNTSTLARAAGEVMVNHCFSCHNPNDLRGNLDMVTPGLVQRTSGVASGTELCRGKILLTPGDPQNSLIFTKLTIPTPCGVPMPMN